MERVLIVSDTGTTLNIISRLLKEYSMAPLAAAASGSHCRRLLLETEFDLIIIDTPLPDESGSSIAEYAAETTDAGIILLVRGDMISDVDHSLEEAGVFVLPKPISPDMFYQSVRILAMFRRRLFLLQQENSKLLARLEECRLVGRAKCLLVQHRALTEKEAHRFIEKESMDKRQSRKETAAQILSLYEDSV